MFTIQLGPSHLGEFYFDCLLNVMIKKFEIIFILDTKTDSVKCYFLLYYYFFKRYSVFNLWCINKMILHFWVHFDVIFAWPITPKCRFGQLTVYSILDIDAVLSNPHKKRITYPNLIMDTL